MSWKCGGLSVYNVFKYMKIIFLVDSLDTNCNSDRYELARPGGGGGGLGSS